MTDLVIQRRFFASWQTRMRQISGATIALIFASLFGRAITLLTQIVIAREFGAGSISDAIFATEAIRELFMDVLGGAFGIAFIPLFAHYRATESEEEARKFALSFFFVFSILAILLALITALSAPWIVQIIAPGFEEQTKLTTLSLIRVMSIAICFLGLNAGLRGLLHSHQAFLTPDIARLTNNSVLLVIVFFLSGLFGPVVLAWGIVLGTFVALLIQLSVARRLNLLTFQVILKHSGVLTAAKQILPILVASSWVTVILILDRIAASELAAGSVATINYATRIILLPVGIFAASFQTTFFPTFSRLSAENRRKEMADHVILGLRILLFIVIPTCVGLTILREPIIRLLFERGAFNHEATVATSTMLWAYAISVPAISAIFFLEVIFFAFREQTLLILLNFASWIVNLTLNLLFVPLFGNYGIALATGISSIGMAIAMAFFLKRKRLRDLDLKSTVKSTASLVVLAGAMGLILQLGIWWIAPFTPDASALNTLFFTLLFSLTGGIIYLLGAYLFELEEFVIMKGRIGALLAAS